MIEVLKQALDALESMANEGWLLHGPEGMDVAQTKCVKAITSLRQAIAELEREKEIHDRHCNQGEWKGVCKYSDSNCPTIAELESQEPVAYIRRNEYNEYRLEPTDNFKIEDIPVSVEVMLYAHPPQRTEQEIKDDGYCQACDGALCTAKKGCVALSNPPQRKPLTDEQIKEIWKRWPHQVISGAIKATSFARAIEAAHGIKEES